MVLTAQFVFMFGSAFAVLGSVFASNHEHRTENREPNLNTNAERRTEK